MASWSKCDGAVKAPPHWHSDTCLKSTRARFSAIRPPRGTQVAETAILLAPSIQKSFSGVEAEWPARGIRARLYLMRHLTGFILALSVLLLPGLAAAQN